MEFQELIRARRSVRSYRAGICHEDLEKILRQDIPGVGDVNSSYTEGMPELQLTASGMMHFEVTAAQDTGRTEAEYIHPGAAMPAAATDSDGILRRVMQKICFEECSGTRRIILQAADFQPAGQGPGMAAGKDRILRQMYRSGLRQPRSAATGRFVLRKRTEGRLPFRSTFLQELRTERRSA